jgi:signal transduction histidine kinase
VRASAYPVLDETRKVVLALMVAREVVVEKAKTAAANGAASDREHRFEDSLLAISSDLRTPVVSIQGMVELFRQKYAEAVPDVTALHYLELTQRNADQIATLIKDLVELSELGRSDVFVTDVPLSAVVEEAWRANARAGMDLRIAGPLPVIRADRAKLARALRDVFDMAVRWRADGAIAWVHVGTKDLGPAWEIEITDNGRNFGPEEGESLFGPLARTASAHPIAQPSQIGGVGVGLAAVRRIAEMHGGSAAVTSAPGKGTTYTLVVSKE